MLAWIKLFEAAKKFKVKALFTRPISEADFALANFKLYLHWQRLRDNDGNNDSDSDMKQYLHWPPWAM
jgi:hypothetical protein